jgi:3-isopropylmalate/(R)-2-methylmalate dehydratase small subunit
MAKEKINKIRSAIVPLKIDNVNTDDIIPSRFLKVTGKTGLKDGLFRDWKFDKDNNLKDFILNKPDYSGKILVSGKNFGCGSSREHAVWAVLEYGFKAIISSQFSDIYRNNALNNGLLTIEVSEKFLSRLFDVSLNDPEAEVEIDLENQTVLLAGAGIKESFEMEEFKRKCLLNGYDDVDYTLTLKSHITKFEEERKTKFSWM